MICIRHHQVKKDGLRDYGTSLVIVYSKYSAQCPMNYKLYAIVDAGCNIFAGGC